MQYKEIFIKDIEPKLSFSSATLRIYISSPNEAVRLRPGMLVCPGGGYSFCSPREAEPIAFRFLSEGFNCFILDYTPYQKYPSPHLELAAAINYIRKHEADFDLIKSSLSIVGFSAGGHLVGSYGYLYPELAKELKYDSKSLRPLAIIMAYPVTLMNEFAHQDTKQIITGGDDNLIKKLDVPSHITSDYPPAFIWATKDDEMVPVENALVLEKSLKNAQILHECLIFESGRHGASMANRCVYTKEELTENMQDIRDWVSPASDFIFRLIDNEN